MKTIVISGASSNVGKTTLAGRVCEILPGAVHVKIGHGARKPGVDNVFYTHGTGFERIESENRGAPFLVIESNGILREIDPDLAIYLPGGSPKPSAAQAAGKADIIGGEPIGRGAISEIAARLGVGVEEASAIAAAAGSVMEGPDEKLR